MCYPRRSARRRRRWTPSSPDVHEIVRARPQGLLSPLLSNQEKGRSQNGNQPLSGSKVGGDDRIRTGDGGFAGLSPASGAVLLCPRYDRNRQVVSILVRTRPRTFARVAVTVAVKSADATRAQSPGWAISVSRLAATLLLKGQRIRTASDRLPGTRARGMRRRLMPVESPLL